MLFSDRSFVLARSIPRPVVCWIVPPEESPPWVALPPPPTVRPAVFPVLKSLIPFVGSVAAVLLPAEMSWKLRVEPIVVLVTSRPTPLVALIEFGLPEMLSVPPPVALTPLPNESMLRPPPVKLIVWPVFDESTTASLSGLPAPALVVVLIAFVLLLNVVVPPLLPLTVMPPPVSLLSLIAPLKEFAPLVRFVIEAEAPVPSPKVPG